MIAAARRRPLTAAPVVDANLYSDEAIADSRQLFARIRHAGPVVWLPRHRMYAIGRFDDVRTALRDDTRFRSGAGVAANPLANSLGRHTTLSSDDETHTARRRVLMRSLGAKAVAAIEEPLAREATAAIDELISRAYFDAAGDFASRLPTRVVSELVGVGGSSDRLLRWAAATFEALGPLNRRSARALPRSLGLLVYSRRLRPCDVAPGSWAASVFDAQRQGELTLAEAKALVIDFIAPSLDTTILATTHLLWVLARHPDAWTEIRTDPTLIPAAVVENVRLASPIRAFTRQLAAPHAIDGIELPKGARVALLFGAANLDETRFADPERFDLHRPSGQHLGWGNGSHTCVGIHLAKLEMSLLLETMIPRVQRIIAGSPNRLHNNTLQGISRLPVRLIPD